MINKLRKTDGSILAWAALILLSLIWGSSFILIKKSLLAFSPLEVGAIRIAIATLSFLPFLFKQLKDVPWDKSVYFLIVGLCGSGVPSFLYAIAQTEVDSSVAGLLNSLTPIFTLIIGISIFKSELIFKQLFGIILGFLGAAALIWLQGNGINTQSNLIYIGMIVLATICYGTSVNVVKYRLDGLSPILISCISFLLTGPFVIVYLFTTDFIDDIRFHPDGLTSLFAVSTLSSLSTFLSTILFYKLVHKTNPVFASSVSFLIPIVALGWGFIDGEYVGLGHLVSLICILAGVYLLRKDKS